MCMRDHFEPSTRVEGFKAEKKDMKEEQVATSDPSLCCTSLSEAP